MAYGKLRMPTSLPGSTNFAGWVSQSIRMRVTASSICWSSQTPVMGVLRSCRSDQRRGDVIPIASSVLDGVRGREPLSLGIDQQASQQARLGCFGPSLMIASIACDLVPHRGPSHSIDQCRMLAGVELVFVGNLTQVNRFESTAWRCQVDQSADADGRKQQLWGLCCRRSTGDVAPCAKCSFASRTMLIGAEVMTAELEMVVDPAVGGEETLRVTR